MQSCIYRGTVTHRRKTPVEHRFRYQLFWLYLDLEEWDQAKQQIGGLNASRFAPAAFCRSDHLGDPGMSLDAAVRQFVRTESGENLADGPIRLLTQPRSFGLYFSPLNLYYCFDKRQQLAAIVAEVNNTPWGEQHCYLLWQGNRVAGCRHEYRHQKTFHVSPFMEMDQQYLWKLGEPGDSLTVHLASEQDGEQLFDAGMQLTQQPLTRWSLTSNLMKSPINAARVLAAIYFEAFRLWIKRCPYYPHPKTKPTHASVA